MSGNTCKLSNPECPVNRGFTGPTGPAGGGDGPTTLLKFSGAVTTTNFTTVLADTGAGGASGYEYPIGEAGLTVRMLSVQLHTAPDPGITYTPRPVLTGTPIALTTPFTFTSADPIGTIKSSPLSSPLNLQPDDSIGVQVDVAGSEGVAVDFTATLSLGLTP